jgi:hypothetical protein
MRADARYPDRLKRVGFIERIGDAAHCLNAPIGGLVGEFDGVDFGGRAWDRKRPRRNGSLLASRERPDGYVAGCYVTAVAAEALGVTGNRGGTLAIT